MLPLFPPHYARSSATVLRKTKKHGAANKFLKYAAPIFVVVAALVFVLANYIMVQSTLSSDGSLLDDVSRRRTQEKCQLRKYPPRRYYKWKDSSNQPDFLHDTEYIFGLWPTMYSISATASQDSSPTITPPQKLCVDQSEWRPVSNDNVLPFADGTNPSILSTRRIRDHIQSATLSSEYQYGLETLWKAFPRAQYIATACMTNSQCQWGDSVQERRDYHLTNQTEPDTVVTVLLLLGQDFASLAQSTLVLRRDAPWGKRYRRAPNDGVELLTPAYDDARLFLHAGQIWVSYREGKGFGWDAQVLNPIHFDAASGDQRSSFRAWTIASETTSFCCGRNMALMEPTTAGKELQSLTWVDPVTVITVDTSPLALRENKRRRLQNKKRSSHIHGTNAFMVHLPDTNEYLGVGHFHRPPGRGSNPYARFGHHYTHCWFTISNQAPHRLTGLSQEFVLSSDDKDAHVIQFASGLEVIDGGKTVVLAYGINDCEAAVTTMNLDSIREMLKPVPEGKQVLDYMKPYKPPKR